MTAYFDQYAPIVRQYAAQYGVPPAIALGVAQQESGFDPTQVGTSGEIGIMQLMPQTSQHLNINPFNPSQNIQGGVSYLSQLYSSYGSWPKALSAYNTGSPDSTVGAAYAASVIAKGTAITGDTGALAGNTGASSSYIIPPFPGFPGLTTNPITGLSGTPDKPSLIESALGLGGGTITGPFLIGILMVMALLIFGIWRLTKGSIKAVANG